MPPDSGPAPEPFFLDHDGIDLFAIYHPPHPGRAPRGNVLFIPPFAEEMNRTRRMAALQARALADAGAGFLMLDLYGTGDSEGQFGHARWRGWRDDIACAVDWLETRNRGPVALLGARAGALLAAETARVMPERIAQLVLWQPVTAGKSALTQFLRVRVAAAMTAGGDAETTKSLRERLYGGEAIEVAGYEISPELARAMDTAVLAEPAPPAHLRIDWLEVASEPGDPVTPGARRVIDAWGAEGCDVTAETVAGEPFWSIQETTTAPALIERTTKIVGLQGAMA